MKYGTDELKQSVFYPACGVDCRPILSFSHLCSTFIFVDYILSPECFTRALTEYVHDMRSVLNPDSVRIISRRPVELAEIGLSPNRPLPDKCAAIIGQACHVNPNWAAVEITLIRRVSRQERAIKVLYLCHEGLATYLSLYRDGYIAPLALVTTTTGIFGLIRLEEPEGVFAQLLTACQAKPKLWLRGGHPIGGRVATELEQIGPYCKLVQTYMDWRYHRVYAFSELDTDFGLHAVLTIDSRRSVKLINRPLPMSNLSEYDAVFVTDHIAKLPQFKGEHAPVEIYLPELRTLGNSLDWIGKVCKEKGYKKVAAVPCGHEDEGAAIPAWASRKKLPYELDFYFDGLFDFADLRDKAAVVGTRQLRLFKY